MEENWCLVVEKGVPYPSGSRIMLEKGEWLLGRSGQGAAGMYFASPFVSRRHCLVCCDETGVSIKELGSRHGTSVNGEPLQQEVRRLAPGDRLELASGLVALRLEHGGDEKTLDLSRTLMLRQGLELPQALALFPERQECQVYGESVSLSGKEWNLLQLLWESAGTLVDYETIKREIWPERLQAEGQGSVDVGTDELNVLIYRLRKKLGDASRLLKTVRGSGLLLTRNKD